TPVGLELPPAISYERYEALLGMLGPMHSTIKFAIGDALIQGEELFGETYAQAAEALAMSPEGRLELRRVALAIPREARRETLSWSHHREVAARWVDRGLRDRLLDRAEKEGLGVHEFVKLVRDLRPGRSDSLHV